MWIRLSAPRCSRSGASGALDAASVPFTETKAPEAPERLHRGALSLIDISASTMANIGPAYSFFFGFGFLVFTAGVAAPLTIIVAGLALALLGHTLSPFAPAQPSSALRHHALSGRGGRPHAAGRRRRVRCCA